MFLEAIRHVPYRECVQGPGESVIEDGEDDKRVINEHSHVLRGGAFYVLAPDVRSAYRYQYRPANRGYCGRPAAGEDLS